MLQYVYVFYDTQIRETISPQTFIIYLHLTHSQPFLQTLL